MRNNLCNYPTLYIIQSQLTKLQNISSTKDAHDNAKQTTENYIKTQISRSLAQVCVLHTLWRVRRLVCVKFTNNVTYVINR
jgi:hypothetical protein